MSLQPFFRAAESWNLKEQDGVSVRPSLKQFLVVLRGKDDNPRNLAFVLSL